MAASILLSGTNLVPASAGLFNGSHASFTVTTVASTPTTLTIMRSNASVIISWPSAAAGYSLQQNPDVNPTHWTLFNGTVSDDGTTKSVTLSSATGSNYFRLIHP